MLFYGSAREHDMDFDQFSILFRSIFLEGLARPLAGVRLILKMLVRRFKELGGELRLRAGVERIAVNDAGACREVVLDDGTELDGRARALVGRLARDDAAVRRQPAEAEPPPPASLSFVEVDLDARRQPRALGYDQTIVFFNDSREVPLRASPTSWSTCAAAWSARPTIRLRRAAGRRHDADHGAGQLRPLGGACRAEAYRLAKLRWYDRMAASAVRFVPDFRRAVIDTDMFTPMTIHRFTGHANGAVYGAPEKRYDGTTHLKNLFICGNDQGLVGIIGTIISGIASPTGICWPSDPTSRTVGRLPDVHRVPACYRPRPSEPLPPCPKIFSKTSAIATTSS